MHDSFSVIYLESFFLISLTHTSACYVLTSVLDIVILRTFIRQVFYLKLSLLVHSKQHFRSTSQGHVTEVLAINLLIASGVAQVVRFR